MRPLQQRGLLVGVGLLVSLLVVNASVVYRQTRLLYIDSEQVARTHELLTSIEDLLSTLKDAETGQRGFVITGEEGYLEHYRAALPVIDEKISRVEQLTKALGNADSAAEAAQEDRFRRLREQVSVKRKELAETIEARNTRGFEAARQAVASHLGKRTMDAIRNITDELRSHGHQLLAERQRIDRNAYWRAVLSNVVAALLGIVAFAAFAGLLQRHLRSVVDSAAAVHQQRELLQATLISIGDAVIATDGDGRVTFLNSIAEDLTGWKIDEARGQSLDAVFSIINEQSRRTVSNPALRAIADGRITGLANHTILISRNGAEWPIDDSAAPIRNEEGGVVGAILVFREITERKRREREQQQQSAALTAANQRKDELVSALKSSEGRFRLAAEAVAGMIYDCTPATGHVERSQGLHAVVGFRAEDVPPTVEWWFDRIHPDDRQPLIDERERMWSQGDRCTNEYRVRHQNGRYLHVVDRALAQRDSEGRIVRFVGCVQDSTDIKEYERVLQEANRHKDEFLATLAHELRNPLAPLSNALQLWPAVEDDRTQMHELRGMMQRQVQQMTRLIDDLLDVSRINRGKVQLRKERIEIRHLISGAIESVQPLIDAQCQHLTVDVPAEPMWVDGDAARLTQVFGNILNNAAKYTGHNGQIALTAERRGTHAVVRIRDNGPGIPPPMLSVIFEMFQQVDQTLDRSHGGLGIGLTLAKRFVDLHDGTIKARSDGPGKGSEFIVTLPIVSPIGQAWPVVQSPVESAPMVRLPPRRVLVVDDIEASATTFSMLLRALGQDASAVQDGPAAIEWVRKHKPDVVFLDIAMPGMNGYEVARRLRSETSLDEIVLVALTGYGQEEDRRKSKAAGFNHHLTKPVTIEVLQALFAMTPPRGNGR